MCSVSVFHETPKEDKPYAILPIGLFYNAGLMKLKPGDSVEFFNAESTESREFVRRCVIPIRSQMFMFMAKSIYGNWVTTDAIVRRWENHAVLNGNKRDVFSHEECLLLEVKP